jgi:hypothetical protein
MIDLVLDIFEVLFRNNRELPKIGIVVDKYTF